MRGMHMQIKKFQLDRDLQNLELYLRKQYCSSRNMSSWLPERLHDLIYQVGDIKSFHGENVIYVVMVTGIDENKYQAKNDKAIESTLKRNKQYEAIASQLAMDAAIEGAENGTFTGVKFNINTVDGKFEPSLAAAIALSRNTGVETKVKGSAGAYVFVVDAINGEVDPETIEAERTPDMTQRESAMARMAVDVLTSKAQIEDMRGEGEI